jgi:hypothetical protein
VARVAAVAALAAGGDFGGLISVILNTLLGLFSALGARVAAVAALAAGGDFGGLISVILNTLLGLFSALAAGGDFGGLMSVILNIREDLDDLEELGDFVFNGILNVI